MDSYQEIPEATHHDQFNKKRSLYLSATFRNHFKDRAEINSHHYANKMWGDVVVEEMFCKVGGSVARKAGRSMIKEQHREQRLYKLRQSALYLK